MVGHTLAHQLLVVLGQTSWPAGLRRDDVNLVDPFAMRRLSRLRTTPDPPPRRRVISRPRASSPPAWLAELEQSVTVIAGVAAVDNPGGSDEV
jgi:hypothetical protein